MLIALLLVGRLAHAATVAVLDFEPWGVTQDDATVATDGVRSALLSGGVLDSLPGSDIADGVSAETEGELRAAREHAAEARRLYLSANDAGAIASASEAVAEHGRALSQIGRRAEFADAWYTLGIACARSTLNIDAADAFSHVAALYPRYLEDRATNIPAVAKPLLAAAEREVGHPRLTREEVQQARDALQVDWVVTGSVSEAGEITAQLWGAGEDGGVTVRGELHGYYVPVPVPEISDVYGRVAADLAKRAAPPRAPVVAEGGHGGAGGEGGSEPRTDKITQRWWFWTGAGALVGGGALLGYALWEPAPVEAEGVDTWSVRVDGL